MPISLYSSSVDIFIKSLLALKRILNKAQSQPNIDATSLPSARLHDDMLPLSFQIQTISNYSQKFLEKVIPAKGPFPIWEDNETTMEELLTRIDKMLKLLESVDAEDLEGQEDRVIEIPMGKTEIVTLEVKGYALGWMVPHVLFHVSIAYAILRSRGVPLGKKDFSSEFMEPVVLEVKEKGGD